MNLKIYLDNLNNLPRPTLEQTKSFIDAFCLEHSWYKHLPWNKGSTFVFYIDPNARKKLLKIEENKVSSELNKFIFSDGSESGVNKFGFWNYYSESYTHNYLTDKDGSFYDSRSLIGLQIINEQGFAESLPNEIIELGKISLTAHIHGSFRKSVLSDSNPSEMEKLHEIQKNNLLTHLQNFIHALSEMK